MISVLSNIDKLFHCYASEYCIQYIAFTSTTHSFHHSCHKLAATIVLVILIIVICYDEIF